ncbi:MAG: nucleoside triphosphate pyrophosphohydrolase family protein [Candidatus Euphemobacter frigidus]|nr:nucleoside triphosphate pyrophosphohydrolase family protein [Candidatus Euphemobacter frigidus]MDP8275406.1 nucleoside triphosphate pyrophosphohydrolase family protein [Candidatus Euphemobacter frigidus]
MKEMVKAVREFHRKYALKARGGEEMLHRMNLIMEEVGEISQCLTKGKPRQDLIEEHADLLILLIGNAISLDFDLEKAFWEKYKKIMRRKGRMINGTIRVSET